MDRFSLINVSKRYNQKFLFKDLNLTSQKGEFLSIVGPSGCGKSTLLKCLAQIESLSSGQIQLSDPCRVSYVFQDPALLPWLNVTENIKISILGSSNLKTQDKKIQETLSLVKLTPYAKSFPHQLSGGMKMRVSIARALLNTPDLLLMDEPFAALDETIRFELQEELLEIWENSKNSSKDKQRMNIVFVTHSQSEAVFLSQRVLKFISSENNPDKSTQFEFLNVSLPNNRHRSLRKTKDFLDTIDQLADLGSS